MKKSTWVIGIVFIAAALVAAYLLIRAGHPSPVPETNGTGNAAVGANGASAVITYTDTGFSPSPFTIAVGTTVTWVNQSSHKMWIGEKDGDCTKGALDECASVSNGGTYSYTFTKVGDIAYVNHQNDADTGKIVVTESAASGPISPNAVPQ